MHHSISRCAHDLLHRYGLGDGRADLLLRADRAGGGIEAEQARLEEVRCASRSRCLSGREGANQMTPGHTLKLLQASIKLIEKDQRIADLERQTLSLKRLLGLRRLAED